MNNEASPWTWWQKALGGDFGPIHEDQPQTGYYRVGDDPVAIWENGGAMVALRAGRAVDVDKVWTWACKKPISHEQYQAVVAGEPWPEKIDAELAAAAQPGHNGGSDHEILLDEIETVERAWESWLASIGGTIASEIHDLKAETFRQRFQDLAKRADTLREEQKRPHLEAGRQVDATWRPVIGHADEMKRRVGSTALPYRKARDDARKAEAAARAAQRDEAPAPAARKERKGFREVQVVVITDALAAVNHILTTAPGQADIVDAIRLVAGRMIKAGVSVPGVTIVTEQRA